jgi:LuxR family maltose regulon positive regulatory protein
VPLAEAKLAAPRQRSGMVMRPDVLGALDAGEEALLTLVAAPAGYGKTTAVRAWCAGTGAPLAWVTLDAGDNDPVRLWTYVATAVDRVRQGLGRQALRRLGTAGGPIENPVDELMKGLADFEERLVLVLDDVQAVVDSEALASIDYALERLPPNVRLIMLTRVDPPVGLAQLRARGGLVELRTGELAFSTEEARELLVQRGAIDLEDDEVEMLRERTEGWPAALFLASYWLRGVEDPHLAAREFRGDHRFVAEYLSREVIDALDDDTRGLLLRASVLERFTAPLCDAVFDRSDSASVLAELARSNFFLVRLEHGGWFRVHPLFAEFASFQLTLLDPGAATEIHRRAAGWLLSRGLPVEAVEHAAAAQEHRFVAELLVDYHLSLIRSGGARTLLRWVQTLPEEEIVEHPELAVSAATAASMIGRSALTRRRFLWLARRARFEHPERFTPYVRCVAAMVSAASVDADVGHAVLQGRLAVAIALTDADEVAVAALAGFARALYLAGQVEEAWTMAMEAVEHPDIDRRKPGHALARSTLALVATERGWIASARVHAEKAKSLVGGVASSRTWLGANASAALGAVLAEDGNLAEAERELAQAEHFFRDEVATVHHAWILVLLARVRCRRGHLEGAEAALHSARESIAELADAGRAPAMAFELEREIEQARGRAEGGELLEAPSEAEFAVLRLLASDLSARQIGEKLFLSANTVRSHTRSIYRKLGVNSRADAVARAGVFGLFGQA